jgi:regulator of protease activity HflC (stomatin/prohibitin superfamily)
VAQRVFRLLKVLSHTSSLLLGPPATQTGFPGGSEFKKRKAGELIMLFRSFKIRSFEKGLWFRDGEFMGLLGTGRHWFVDPLRKVCVDVANQRDPWLAHPQLDLIAKSGVLAGEAVVLDLKDADRALVWVDNRFNRIVGPGLYALWTNFREVRVELVDARTLRFDHKDLNAILNTGSAGLHLYLFNVQEGRQAVITRDGEPIGTFGPGRYTFWKGQGNLAMTQVDTRESVLDVSGQELMTADKVTLRLNAVATYRVVDVTKAVTFVDNWQSALYREAQLALRAVVGTRELDTFLTDKDALARELQEMLAPRVAEFGVQLIALGIKDVILPGDMKELLNKVIQARKAAQANLIARQEETAAMRSQANTAKLLDNNPTLMRLRELEVLEKVAAGNKLNVVLGEKGLADRVINLL